MIGQQIEVWRAPAATDAYGDPVAGTYARSHRIDGCAIEHLPASTTVEPGRIAQSYALQVYAPAAADLRVGDRVQFPDGWWQAVENPRTWQSPFSGWSPGVVARFELVKG